MYNLRERIAIMIDYHDIWTEGPLPRIEFWRNLNYWLINQFMMKTHVTDREVMHMGTWMFVKSYSNRVQESAFEEIDNEHGFIVKYGLEPNREKGIDVNLVCQMLVGAHEDRYDACILLSDDLEFEPAIHAVQNMNGKRVFHTGFTKTRLRAACFGNLALEQYGSLAEVVELIASQPPQE